MRANKRQREAWNQGEAVHFVDHADSYDRQLASITEALVERTRLESEHAVLDVGCGCGAMTLMAAGRARHATGVDFSEPLVTVATDRARSASLHNVDFVVADAQTLDFGAGAYDRVLSQFGVMFFDDPVGAFSNLRAALNESGLIVFATWQPLQENAWLAPIINAVGHFAEVPELGGLSAGPGMFALEETSDIAAVLRAAGFSDISIDSASPALLLGGGGTFDETASFVLDAGIVRGLMDHLSAADHAAASSMVRDELARHYEPNVGVRMDAAVWLVTARA